MDNPRISEEARGFLQGSVCPFWNLRMTSPYQTDLFDEPDLPAGFRYEPDVLSAEQEQHLVRQFEQLEFQPYEFRGFSAKRRIHAFGGDYSMGGQRPRDASEIPANLRALQEIAGRISGAPATSFEHIMVTEYASGAGIGWHRDRPAYEHVVGFSFLAPCVLRLRREQGKSWERRSVVLEPRSVYLLSGEARHMWQHSIAPMETLRYSVTLRTPKGSGQRRVDDMP
jgi:alkylated DNA repair dioxygenase AlkB